MGGGHGLLSALTMSRLRLPRPFLLLALAGAAGALLWYNSQHSSQTPVTAPAPSAPSPDWTAIQASSWHLELTHDEQFFIQAEHAKHWKPADLTDLEKPRGWLAKPGADYRFRAETGRLGAQQIYLQGQAQIHQLAPHALRLESERLDYHRNRRLLTTDTALRLTAQSGWTTGIGLQWWLDEQRLTIQREVHTHYAP